MGHLVLSTYPVLKAETGILVDGNMCVNVAKMRYPQQSPDEAHGQPSEGEDKNEESFVDPRHGRERIRNNL